MAHSVSPSSPTSEIESRLIDYIQRELLTGGRTIRRDENLLSGKLLDSLAVLRLAAFVSREFDFEVAPEDFVIENFQSVDVLADYVLKATSATD